MTHAHAGHEHQGHGGHAHVHGLSARRRVLYVALGLNVAFLAVEVVIGYLTNSLAVLGDAAHMGTDVAVLILALAAERLSVATGGPNHTFGYRRAPTLGAFGNALSMLVLTFVLLYEALRRIGDPPHIPATPVLIAGVIGLAVNVASAWVLHQGSSDSHNVRGAMLHMLGDALGSIGVIVSAVIIETTGWYLADPLVTILLSGLIMWATWPLLRDSTRTLLQITPRDVDVPGMRKALLAHDQVTCVEDLHTWELDAGYLVVTATVHVRCDGLEDCDNLREVLRAELEEGWDAAHVTLELTVERDHPTLPLRPCVGGL